MSQVSRRSFLKGSAALGALVGLGTTTSSFNKTE